MTISPSVSTSQADINLDTLLAERHQIAIIWCTEDVRQIRSELSEDQAWKVLEECRDQHDCESGITWDLIASIADNLF